MQTTQNFHIYKASAGSGKTFQLVKYYIKYVMESNDPSEFKKILAVTFTNKAANEMKERILKALFQLQLEEDHPDFHQTYAEALQKEIKNKNLSTHEIQELARKTLHVILHSYGDFAVMTIDKFIHRLIRSFSKELDINMDFEVEMDTAKVMKAVADELIAKVGEGSKNLTDFILNMVQDSLEDGKSWKHNEKLGEIAHLLVNDEYIKEVEEVTKYNLDDFRQLADQLNQKIYKFESDLVDHALQMKKEIELAGYEVLDITRGVNGFGGRINKYLNKDFSKTDANKTFLGCLENENWFAKTHSAHQNETLNQGLTKIGQDILKLLQTSDYYNAYKLVKSNLYWVALLSEMRLIFERMKEEDNFLLISEFNQKATALILEESVPFIYEKLGERYEHFLIDEFQDTSELQFRNFLPLIDNAIAKGKQNLIVGDAKQSIYRFRGGKVEQFNALPKVINAENSDKISLISSNFDREHQFVGENINWRSSKTIVQFNNTLYQNLSDHLEVTEDFSLLDNVFEDAAQDCKSDKKGYVQLNFNDCEDKHELEDWFLQKTLASIRGIIDDQNSPFHLRDIAILVRKNAQGKSIASYLSQNNIDVISEESLIVISDFQVQFFWSLLQHMVYPKNNTLKKEVLIAFAKMNGEEPAKYLNKTATFETFLMEYGLHLDSTSWSGSSLYLMHLRWIEKSQINLTGNAYVERYLEEVYQYEKYNGPSWSGFVSHFKERKHKVSISFPEGNNAVRIMSIHKSKGLEFPVVILPFLNWSLNDTKGIYDFVDLQWMPVDTKIQKIYTRLKKEEIYEPWAKKYKQETNYRTLDMLNMLYVATTRAERELYLFSGKTKQNTLGNKILEALKVENIDPDHPVEWGSRVEGEKEKLNIVQQSEITPLQGDIPNEISYKNTWYENIDAQIDWTIKRGNMMHKALEFINDGEKWKITLQKLKDKGVIDPIMKIDELIEVFVSNEKLSPFFDPMEKVLCEQDIVDEKGQQFRIDRMWESDDTIIILDFKYGSNDKNQAKHEAQVSKYMQLVSSMTEKQVNGWVAYTNGEVIEVQQTSLF